MILDLTIQFRSISHDPHQLLTYTTYPIQLDLLWDLSWIQIQSLCSLLQRSYCITFADVLNDFKRGTYVSQTWINLNPCLLITFNILSNLDTNFNWSKHRADSYSTCWLWPQSLDWPVFCWVVDIHYQTNKQETWKMHCRCLKTWNAYNSSFEVWISFEVGVVWILGKSIDPKRQEKWLEVSFLSTIEWCLYVFCIWTK